MGKGFVIKFNNAAEGLDFIKYVHSKGKNIVKLNSQEAKILYSDLKTDKRFEEICNSIVPYDHTFYN